MQLFQADERTSSPVSPAITDVAAMRRPLVGAIGNGVKEPREVQIRRRSSHRKSSSSQVYTPFNTSVYPPRCGIDIVWIAGLA